MINHNPEKIISKIVSETTPLMRYTGNIPFDEWQKNAHDKLYELLGLSYMLPCDDPQLQTGEITEYEEYTQQSFTFQSEPGYYVPGYLLVPKNKTGAIPTVICIPGHCTGMHNTMGLVKYPADAPIAGIRTRDYARIAVKRGYCAVVIEARYMGECGGDEEGPGCCANGREGTASAVKALLTGRCAIGERVWDISKTIDVVCSAFDFIDENNITCLGSSGGGTAAFYAACIDKRIKYVLPSCSICTYLASIINIYHCPCNYIPSIARYFDMGDLGGLIAPRKLIIVSGEKDDIFPIEGVYKTMDIIYDLYRHAGADGNAVLLTGNEGHRFYGDISFDALDKAHGF